MFDRSSGKCSIVLMSESRSVTIERMDVVPAGRDCCCHNLQLFRALGFACQSIASLVRAHYDFYFLPDRHHRRVRGATRQSAQRQSMAPAVLDNESVQLSRSDTIFPFWCNHHDRAGRRGFSASVTDIAPILRGGARSIGDGAGGVDRR